MSAGEADGIVRLLHRPGQFVVKGATMAVAACRRLPGSKLEEIFEGSVTIGVCRMVHHDNEFAVSQIVEIALRAMSPGLNNPTTALTCVDWLGDSIRTLARYPRPNPARVDNSGKVRVVEKVNDIERVVAAAFDPIRQVARNSSMLTIRLLNTLKAMW